MITISDIEKLWKLFDDYKETAEQYEFITLIMIDAKLTPLYKDLHENWNEQHAELFANIMREKVFPMLGIKEDMLHEC